MIRSARGLALRTCLWYVLLGSVWILASDAVMVHFVSSPWTLATVGVYKGWAFVAATAALLYLVLRREVRHWEASQLEVTRLGRLYATLSGINAVAARATSCEQLFADVCRIATQEAGFELAWIGWRDPESHLVRPVARAGQRSGYLEEVLPIDDGRTGQQGPIGLSLRENRPVILNDFLNDDRAGAFHDAARRHDLRAVASLPLRVKGEVCGVLAVYAGRPDAFREREIALLTDTVATISAAVDMIDREDQRWYATIALSESENRFRQMAQITDEVFWLALPHSQGVLYLSPAYERIWGQRCEDAYADPSAWMAPIVAEDRAHVERALKELDEGTPYDIEFRIIRPDGAVRWINDRGYPQRNDSGQVVMISGIGTDVTERRHAHERLQQLLRAVEQSQVSIIITNTRGEIEYVNPKFTAVSGYRAEEVLGRNPRVLKSGRTSAADYERLWRTITGGGEWRGMFCNRKKNGETYWESASISPILDASGQVTHYVAVKEDITDRRAAELALSESEARFRSLVEKIPAGIFVQVAGRFVYANDHAIRMFGAAAVDDLLDTLVLDHMHPDDRAHAAERMHGLLDQRQAAAPAELRGLRLDGSVFTGEFSGEPIDHEGQPGALVFCRDIGDRLQLESQLRQAQKMEAIGTLAGGVAHDFNNLLTIIQASASMQLLQGASFGERRDLAEQIVQAAGRAGDLTRQLLLFSRKQTLQAANVDMSDLVTNLAKMLRRIVGEDVSFQTVCGPGLSLVRGDAGLLEQVLLNLVVNARDAMPSGGQLTITTSAGALEESDAARNPEMTAGRYACVSVSDTGTGIPPGVLPHIFEPFFTTKSVGRGTGLGLATVYGIVKQHRGWITVDSAPGTGTTFRVFFPALATGIAAAPAAAIVRELKQGAGTILVVEDDELVRGLASHVLRSCGYTVLEAASGTAALDVWQVHRDEIRVLVTDVVMPDRPNGVELGARLTIERPDLRVIYSSGYGPEHAAVNLPLDEGVNFLKKPYDAAALADFVHDVLH